MGRGRHEDTEEELKVHREEFDEMDKDEDGILSRVRAAYGCC